MRGGSLRCVHCGRDIGCGVPAAGGPPCLGQFHVGSGEVACFPERGVASPRARPVEACGCAAPGELVPSGPGMAPPPVPAGVAGPGSGERAGERAGAGAGSGVERLAEVGRAFLDRVAPPGAGAGAGVVELADRAGVCVVQAVRGGGKVYVAPDETLLFVPSAMDFATGLASFLGGARTP